MAKKLHKAQELAGMLVDVARLNGTVYEHKEGKNYTDRISLKMGSPVNGGYFYLDDGSAVVISLDVFRYSRETLEKINADKAEKAKVKAEKALKKVGSGIETLKAIGLSESDIMGLINGKA